MMKNWVLVLGCLAPLSSAAAQEIEACQALIRVAKADRMREYTDPQLERVTCMASQLLLRGITERRPLVESVCMEATEHAVREFKRRFPKRDVKEVIGKC
jgi:catabolite regulation protein CreA